MKQVAIIGGGAAGMMAAARIQELDPSVLVVLFEKNPDLGKKVKISGGGRCNVTTGIRDVRELLTRYERGSKFLTSAQWNFPPEAVYDWFEDHGVPLKTEEDMRVFPQSNNGADVVGVFEQLFSRQASGNTGAGGVEVRLKTSVDSIEKNGEQFLVRSVTKNVGEQTEEYDAVILTTGGQAYRHTGSTGDGYTFAESLGHSVTDLAASLNAFVLEDEWTHTVPGVSFECVVLTAEAKDEFGRESTASVEGPIVFTHRGMSGPAVFALSAKVAFKEYSKKQPLALQVNWVPGHNAELLMDQIVDVCEREPKKQVVRALQEWLPKSVAQCLLENAGVDPQSKLAEFGKKARRQVIQQLVASDLNIIGRSAGSEFVTAGGVDTKEIDPSTMQSKITPGLFFAGEIMNVDGVTGGFNLQASWAAGRLAGESTVEYLSL